MSKPTLDLMRSTGITAALLALVSILAITSAAAPAASGGASQPRREQTQLEPRSGVAGSAALHTIGDSFAGGNIVESPRRLVGLRLQEQVRLLTDAALDESGHSTLLRLLAAGRDRLEIGDMLARNVSGAISFHTSTPPPTRVPEGGHADA